MDVKTFNDGTKGVVVRDVIDGQARVRALSPERLELAAQAAPGTFPTYVTLDREAAANLGEFLTAWSRGEVEP
jgi:hypothetical protein